MGQILRTFITDKGNFKDIMNTSIKCSRKKCSIGVVGKKENNDNAGQEPASLISALHFASHQISLTVSPIASMVVLRRRSTDPIGLALQTQVFWRVPAISFSRCYNDETAAAAAAAAKSLQSCRTLCNPIDGSPPGSPVPGILQARTLEWVAISFSRLLE